VACHTPGVHMLEDRADLAVLWDIRVAPEHRAAALAGPLALRRRVRSRPGLPPAQDRDPERQRRRLPLSTPPGLPPRRHPPPRYAAVPRVAHEAMLFVVPEPVSGPGPRVRCSSGCAPGRSGLAGRGGPGHPPAHGGLRLNAFLPRPRGLRPRAFYTQAWPSARAPLYGWPAAFLDGLVPLGAAPGRAAQQQPPLTAVVYLPLTLFSFPYGRRALLPLCWRAGALRAAPGAPGRGAGRRRRGLGRGLAVVYGPTYLGLTLGQNAVLSLLALLALAPPCIIRGGAPGHRPLDRRYPGLLPPLWLKLWPAAVAAVLPLWRPVGGDSCAGVCSWRCS
jgi:hypothetical protein